MLRRHSCPAQQAYKPTKVTLCIQMAAPFTNGLIAHLPGINLINCCRRFTFSVQTPFRMHNYKYSRFLITPASASIGVATHHQLIIILPPNRLIGQLSNRYALSSLVWFTFKAIITEHHMAQYCNYYIDLNISNVQLRTLPLHPRLAKAVEFD